MTSPQNRWFWHPLPPLSPFVTNLVEPPPPYVTGPNGDKLFLWIFFRKYIEKIVNNCLQRSYSMQNVERIMIIDKNLNNKNMKFAKIFFWWGDVTDVPPMSPLGRTKKRRFLNFNLTLKLQIFFISVKFCVDWCIIRRILKKFEKILY